LSARSSSEGLILILLLLCVPLKLCTRE
jgi:hypothetical protein